MKKRKRKKRSDNQDREYVLSTRVSKKERNRIRGFAKLQGQKVSEYLRERGLDRAPKAPR